MRGTNVSVCDVFRGGCVCAWQGEGGKGGLKNNKEIYMCVFVIGGAGFVAGWVGM